MNKVKIKSMISKPGLSLTLNIVLPPLRVNMCGWLNKMSTGLTTSGTWKKKWFVLCGDHLYHYESPWHMSHVKSLILCLTMRSFTQSADGGVLINYVDPSDGTKRLQWNLRWADPESTPEAKRCWERRIIASSEVLLLLLKHSLHRN